MPAIIFCLPVQPPLHGIVQGPLRRWPILDENQPGQAAHMPHEIATIEVVPEEGEESPPAIFDRNNCVGVQVVDA